MSRWQSIVGTPGAIWNEESSDLRLAWLGQAGFLVRAGTAKLLIDPYLSDSLEVKYRGTTMPHPRLMPIPATVEELAGIDVVLCTHRHTDHMDGETLREVAARNPDARFLVPRAEREAALRLEIPEKRLLTIDAGEEFELMRGVTVRAVAAAHEALERNELGEHRYLGYILRAGDGTVYHSGDTVPFPGLVESLSGQQISLALLPINGRGKGVAGNFTFAEAIETCVAAGIPEMVPHHFGMFAFNTVDPAQVIADVARAARTTGVRCHVPDVAHGLSYSGPA